MMNSGCSAKQWVYIGSFPTGLVLTVICANNKMTDSDYFIMMILW